MNILINAAGNKAGGGVQVADSICRNLYRFPKHRFTVVLSDALVYLYEGLINCPNIIVERYTTSNRLSTLLTGRDSFLDNLVERDSIDAVFFPFGPSLWIPRVLTVSGFAMPHLVLNDSPFWKTLPPKELLKNKLRIFLQKRSFDKLSNTYYTENPYISDKLSELFPKKKVVTISNTCHQIFDEPKKWDKSINLPDFDGFTLLTICANYPHKNLNSIPKILDILRRQYPTTNFRFVVTVNSQDLGSLSNYHKEHIVFLGRINISQCPWLYQQCDAMFLPTMLECFSANYVEAMKMGKPILTSNLGFARSLCNDCAVYFDTLSPEDMADKISLIAGNADLQRELISKGLLQLAKFDTPKSRTDKIINLIEEAYIKNKK